MSDETPILPKDDCAARHDPACARCGRTFAELPDPKSFLVQSAVPPGYLCNLCVVGLWRSTERERPSGSPIDSGERLAYNANGDGDSRSRAGLHSDAGTWKTIQADAFRYTGRTGRRAMLSAYIHHPGFRFTYYLRKVTHYARTKRGIGFFGYLYNRILFQRYRMRYGFDISPTTMIGPGLYIGHFGGVVVSPHAVLGKNVNIAQGVTIGSASAGPRKGAPKIEDRVWIGANAVLVGKITVGCGALIGPGAYVFFDVPSGAVVLGNPGTIVGHSGSSKYVNNTLET